MLSHLPQNTISSFKLKQKNNIKKLHKVMKFKRFIRATTAIICCACFTIQVYAAGDDQTLTIQATNRPITDVLREVRKQSGYDFFYHADLFKNMPPNSLALQNANIREALDQCLSNTGLSYTINNKIVTITKDQASSNKPSTNRQKGAQQSGTISGVVNSSNG